MADWSTISALATGVGTLVLAVATFSSVRSANRAARTAERSLLVGLRPLLMPSRPEDASQKVSFVDGRWFKIDGAHAAVDASDDIVYLAFGLHNAGRGIAVLDGWMFRAGRLGDVDIAAAKPEEFRRLTRDIYVPAGDNGFWQGALRDPAEEVFADARNAILTSTAFTVDLLYGDHEGGQRMISRFTVDPKTDGIWLIAVARHWTLDQVNPRS
jgi:hypothetical protein